MKQQAISIKDDDTNEQKGLEKIKFYSPEELRAIKIRGILCLAGGCAIHLVLGTFYLFGGISPYVAAYLKSYDDSVTQKFIQIIFPIMGVLMFSSLSFGIKIAQIIGIKFMTFFGGLIISLAFLVLSFITDLGAFVAIYCIFVGITSGLVYMLPIICGWKYFPNDKAIVSGIILCAYGFGSFIFNFVCQAICNPNNDHPSNKVIEDGKSVKYFTSDVYENVPYMLRILALSYGILTIIGTLLLNYPEDLENYHLSLEAQKLTTKQITEVARNQNPPEESPTNDSPTKVIKPIDITLKQGLMSKPFILLVGMVLTSILWGMFMANSYKVYGLSVNLSDTQLTIVGSCQSAANGSSRIFWSFFLKKYGFKKLYLVLCVVNIITCGIMQVISSNFIGYLLIELVIFSAEGGFIASYPVISAQMFGPKIGSIIYGGMFCGIGISNMLGFILYYFLSPIINFEGVFWIVFGINFISLGLGIIFKEHHTWT
ncbi:hypothetical protein pb186bvf_006146 [Paramecium bursaria]